MQSSGQIDGIISGTNGLTVSGSGTVSTLALTAANTFSGPITINAAKLEYPRVDTLGVGSAPIVLNDGTLIFKPIDNRLEVLSRPVQVCGYQSIIRAINWPSFPLTIAEPISGPGGVLFQSSVSR